MKLFSELCSNICKVIINFLSLVVIVRQDIPIAILQLRDKFSRIFTLSFPYNSPKTFDTLSFYKLISPIRDFRVTYQSLNEISSSFIFFYFLFFTGSKCVRLCLPCRVWEDGNVCFVLSLFHWLSKGVDFSSSSLVWLRCGQTLFSDKSVAMPKPGHLYRRKSRIHSTFDVVSKFLLVESSVIIMALIIRGLFSFLIRKFAYTKLWSDIPKLDSPAAVIFSG